MRWDSKRSNSVARRFLENPLCARSRHRCAACTRYSRNARHWPARFSAVLGHREMDWPRPATKLDEQSMKQKEMQRRRDLLSRIHEYFKVD